MITRPVRLICLDHEAKDHFIPLKGSDVRNLSRSVRRSAFRSKVLRVPVTMYRQRGLRDDDVLLATFPRSGTTWMKFLLYEGVTGETADFYMLRQAVPYIGDHGAGIRWLPGEGRFIQTHEQFCNSQHKTIYVIRDPRSVAVSQYYWLQRRAQSTGDMSEFIPRWVRGEMTPWGTWESHVRYWLSSRPAKSERFHLVKYEDLKADPVPILRAAVDFVGGKSDDQVLAAAVDNNSVEKMRAKEDAHIPKHSAPNPEIRFVRSGSSAGWREELGPAEQKAIVQAFGDTMVKMGYRVET